ncbi:RNA polymerase sigma factor [Rufibacter sp. DG15C]|uniref:RNA polymerase sigma factor n=1 Tax=Rufibacter sp. DG15C TaxID=1379909 RepID=UPI000B141A6D|nr:sigma-70 family RNA polymerase sigma factor [Rufibacter sp. DG15C]
MYCRDPEERKDLFQEIVLQLWRSYPTFKHESKVSTWMYRVALNTAVSSFRKESRRPHQSSLSDLDLQIPSAPDTSAEYELKIKYLYSAIDQLSQVEKAIVMLYLEDKSYDEIAEIIGITKSNVGVKLNRIKAKLEKLLTPVYDEIR